MEMYSVADLWVVAKREETKKLKKKKVKGISHVNYNRFPKLMMKINSSPHGRVVNIIVYYLFLSTLFSATI